MERAARWGSGGPLVFPSATTRILERTLINTDCRW